MPPPARHVSVPQISRYHVSGHRIELVACARTKVDMEYDIVLRAIAHNIERWTLRFSVGRDPYAI
jgi:hypothetical protein